MQCSHHREMMTIEVTVPPCQVAQARALLAQMGLPATEENIRWHFAMFFNQVWDQACFIHRQRGDRCDPGGGPLGSDDKEPEY